MAKRSTGGRKSSGTTGIAIIEDPADETANASLPARAADEEPTPAPKREKKTKPKTELQPESGFNVADVRKAAAFVNSVGGLGKAISILQILKVAKDVQ